MAIESLFPLDDKHRQDFFALPEELRNKILPPFDMDAPVPLHIRLLVSPEKRRALEAAMLHQKTSPENYPNILKAERLQATANGGGEARHAVAPPTTNRGGTQNGAGGLLPSYESKERLKIVSLGKNGKFQQVAIPKRDKTADNRFSFVDWVNFTFNKFDVSLDLPSGHAALNDDDYVTALSLVLERIFGYGVTSKRPTGLNFYTSSFELGFHGWGHVCIGGQRDSVLVTVKGQGLMAAKPGWERRLYDFLRGYESAKLTRVDLASDNFDSKTSLNDYFSMYMAGMFDSRARRPEVEQLGNWVKPSGKGRTLYIGGRKTGKLLRIYEKGLQLANGFHEKFPNWVRVELELKAIDRIIPLESLLNPGKFLAGAYPALANLHTIQERILTFKKDVESTVERSVETTRHQFGKHIWMHVQLFGVEETIARLTHGKEELPPRINPDTYENFSVDDYLHSQPTRTHKLEEIPL